MATDHTHEREGGTTSDDIAKIITTLVEATGTWRAYFDDPEYHARVYASAQVISMTLIGSTNQCEGCVDIIDGMLAQATRHHGADPEVQVRLLMGALVDMPNQRAT